MKRILNLIKNFIKGKRFKGGIMVEGAFIAPLVTVIFVSYSAMIYDIYNQFEDYSKKMLNSEPLYQNGFFTNYSDPWKEGKKISILSEIKLESVVLDFAEDYSGK
ncbi:MAG: hypothetical protein MJ113_05140 [Lachnospiraceae bacterium]|nr:hypothetical protein [Lachnospiraceae bacterium]